MLYESIFDARLADEDAVKFTHALTPNKEAPLKTQVPAEVELSANPSVTEVNALTNPLVVPAAFTIFKG